MSIVFRWGNLKKINCLEDLGDDGRIILKEPSRNRVLERGLDRSGPSPGTCVGVILIAVTKTHMKGAKFID
jgi:hypothetical protein